MRHHVGSLKWQTNLGRSFVVIISLFILSHFLVGGCGGSGDGKSDYVPPIRVGLVGQVGGAIRSGVTVYLTGPVSQSAITDHDGYFSFLDIPNGSYTMTPSLAGYTFNPARLSKTVNGNNQSGFGFWAAGQYCELTGTITGDTISGVTITMSGDQASSTTTDANGNFSFFVPHGNYTVTPVKSGYRFTPRNQTIDISGLATDADFSSLSNSRPFTITGNVVGDVISGVKIDLAGPVSATTTTDLHGNYSFYGTTFGSYTLTASYAGHTFSPRSQSVSISLEDVQAPTFVSKRYTGPNFRVVFDTGRPGVHMLAVGKDIDASGVPELEIAYSDKLIWHRGVDYSQQLQITANQRLSSRMPLMPSITGNRILKSVDIDGDLEAEFIIVNGESLNVYDTEGNLEYSQTFTGASLGLTLSDLDDNGIFELILKLSYGYADDQILVLDGTSSYDAVFDSGRVNENLNAESSDIDYDGIPELLINNGQKATWYDGTSYIEVLSINFSTNAIYRSISMPSSSANSGEIITRAGNLDGDAGLEFIVTEDEDLMVYSLDGTMKFTRNYPGATVFASPLDVDNDGVFEIVVELWYGSNDDQVIVLDGALSYSKIFDSGRNGKTLYAFGFDLEGDGIPELAVLSAQNATWYSGQNLVQKFSVTGSNLAVGTILNAHPAQPSNANNWVLKAADFDGDSGLELLIKDGQHLKILDTNGSEVYTKDLGVSNGYVRAHDYDSDGIFEITATMHHASNDSQVIVIDSN